MAATGAIEFCARFAITMRQVPTKTRVAGSGTLASLPTLITRNSRQRLEESSSVSESSFAAMITKHCIGKDVLLSKARVSPRRNFSLAIRDRISWCQHRRAHLALDTRGGFRPGESHHCERNNDEPARVRTPYPSVDISVIHSGDLFAKARYSSTPQKWQMQDDLRVNFLQLR
jgi:hypothetical protein